MNEYLQIATVLKPQGVRGECKLRSYAADIAMFNQWKTLFRKTSQGYEPVSFRTVRIRDGFVYAVMDGSTSADEAEKYRGADLYIDRSQAAPPEEDADLIADLIGCRAVDENGVSVGFLADVLQYGTVDTWVFRPENGTSGNTLMAPALKAVFPSVDIENKTIHVLRDRLEEVAVRS